MSFQSQALTASGNLVLICSPGLCSVPHQITSFGYAKDGRHKLKVPGTNVSEVILNQGNRRADGELQILCLLGNIQKPTPSIFKGRNPCLLYIVFPKISSKDKACTRPLVQYLLWIQLGDNLQAGCFNSISLLPSLYPRPNVTETVFLFNSFCF